MTLVWTLSYTSVSRLTKHIFRRLYLTPYSEYDPDYFQNLANSSAINNLFPKFHFF